MSASLQRRVLVVSGLVVVWVLGWGEVSVANVLSGIAVAVVALLVFPLDDLPGSGRPRIHLLPLVELVGFFLWELVVSNVAMARDLLGSRGRIRTGVIAYRMRVESDALLTSLANVAALTPGAMPIQVTKDPCTIYLHVTRMHERETTIRNLARYEALFVRSFGSDEQRAQLAAATGTTEAAS